MSAKAFPYQRRATSTNIGQDVLQGQSRLDFGQYPGADPSGSIVLSATSNSCVVKSSMSAKVALLSGRQSLDQRKLERGFG